MPWYPEYESDAKLRYIIDSYKIRLNENQVIFDELVEREGRFRQKEAMNAMRMMRVCRNKIFKAEMELHVRWVRTVAMAMSNLQPRVKEQST